MSLFGGRAERRLRRSSGTNVDVFGGFGLNSGTDVTGGVDRRSSEENVGGLSVGVSLKVILGFSCCNGGVVLKLGIEVVELAPSLDFSLCKDCIGATDGRYSLWTKSREGGDGSCSSFLW